MLTALHIGNFKAFAETQRIPIKPLTLIFGPNSAGKSSIIHSLALAHEANRTGNLDVIHTEVGGEAIDLGGFRQYVHRRDSSLSMEWGATFLTQSAPGRLAELLQPVDSFTAGVTIGVPLDDLGEPQRGAVPHVSSFELRSEGNVFLRMSRRPAGSLTLDRIDLEHPALARLVEAVVDVTTTDSLSKSDFDAVLEDVAGIVSALQSVGGSFMPEGLQDRSRTAQRGPEGDTLIPVSKGGRQEALATAFRLVLPRTLNELVRDANLAVTSALGRLQYLGPLRSYPPRHLAFLEPGGRNWYAGGGYAWDVVRQDGEVREHVNRWLGAEFMKTPYELALRPLYDLEDVEKSFDEVAELMRSDERLRYFEDYCGSLGEDFADIIQQDEIDNPALALASDYVFSDLERARKGEWPGPEGGHDFGQMMELIDQSAEPVQDLWLIDKLRAIKVSHRDVGIGVSQALPVLVYAFANRENLIAIEQPEIHLHPALQAELGDVFIESSLGDQGNTFLLETHSEHLILRMLRRIRETTDGELPAGCIPITPDDLSVVWIEPGPDGAEAVEIRVTEDGEFDRPWPDGFFTERAKELF